MTLGESDGDTVVLGLIDAVTELLSVTDAITLPDTVTDAVTERLAADAMTLGENDGDTVVLGVNDSDTELLGVKSAVKPVVAVTDALTVTDAVTVTSRDTVAVIDGVTDDDGDGDAVAVALPKKSAVAETDGDGASDSDGDGDGDTVSDGVTLGVAEKGSQTHVKGNTGKHTYVPAQPDTDDDAENDGDTGLLVLDGVRVRLAVHDGDGVGDDCDKGDIDGDGVNNCCAHGVAAHMSTARMRLFQPSTVRRRPCAVSTRPPGPQMRALVPAPSK